VAPRSSDDLGARVTHPPERTFGIALVQVHRADPIGQDLHGEPEHPRVARRLDHAIVRGQATDHETLDPALTPIEFIRDARPMHESDAVALLGRFLFSYRQAQGPIARLSGGEKSRLQLARLMVGGVNCLLLDEPTNHLDIASTEVLEEALNAFDGTVLTISHDRYFLDRLCGRILELEDGEAREYHGGYTDYALQKERLLALA